MIIFNVLQQSWVIKFTRLTGGRRQLAAEQNKHIQTSGNIANLSTSSIFLGSKFKKQSKTPVSLKALRKDHMSNAESAENEHQQETQNGISEDSRVNAPPGTDVATAVSKHI